MLGALWRNRRRRGSSQGQTLLAQHTQSTPENDTLNDEGNDSEIPPIPTTSYTPHVARKIHPDLNALAAELETQPPKPRKSLDALNIDFSNSNPTSTRELPLGPRLRPRKPSHEPEPQPTSHPSPPVSITPAQPAAVSAVSLASAPSSHTDTSLTYDTSVTPSSATPETQTKTRRLLNRLTNLAQRTPPSLATANPPSAWSTFGRKTVREVISVPHLTDFGESSRSAGPSRPLSRSASQKSQAGTSGSRPDTPASAPHVDPPTPVSAVHSTSSPSSGFTFGSWHGGKRQESTPPPLPPLDHPAFNQSLRTDMGHDRTASNDDPEHDTTISMRHPRHSSSLPSMSAELYSWTTDRQHPDSREVFASTKTADNTPSGTLRSRSSINGDTRRRGRSRRQRSTSSFQDKAGALPPTSPGSAFGSPNTRGNLTQTSNQNSPGSALGSPFSLQAGAANTTHPYDLSTSFSFDKAPEMSPSPPPQLGPQSDTMGTGKGDRIAAPLLVPPSVTLTGATPDPSPIEPRTPPPVHDRGKGKRKADEVDGNTPPDSKRATFSAHDPRPHRASATSSSSQIPSSYDRKRAKLSGTTFSGAAPGMAVGHGVRPASRTDSYGGGGANAFNTGSGASRGSKSNWTSQASRSGHAHVHHQSSSSSQPFARAPSPSRRSISQTSIPISALISPHAPSTSHRSATFHMRDPRRPAPVQDTPWSLSLPESYSRWKWKDVFARLRGRGGSGVTNEKGADQVGWIDGGGSPLHAWLFFVGFVLFPVWWAAGFLVGIPRTRRLEGGMDHEKGVVLDDPQVEHDARAWRKRCRILAAISLVTYLPFIVLVAVFARRRT